MRKARYLGYIDRLGNPMMTISMGKYPPGDVLVVYPFKSRAFPWADTKNPDVSKWFAKFRTEELEFLPEKEFDPNDYL